MTVANLHRAERSAKSIGLIIAQPDELAEFGELTEAQKGYFLHWVRSNQRTRKDWWVTGMRKAREQRA